MTKLLNTLYLISNDTYCRLDGENIVIERNSSNPVRFPLHTLESIVIFSYQGLSPALLGKCASDGIDITFCDPNGRILARVTGIPNGNVLLRREQYRIADNVHTRMEYAKRFILGKVYNSRWILERMCRDHLEIEGIDSVKAASNTLKVAISRILTAASEAELMGIEGDCAKHYFSVFSKLILQNTDFFSFSSRTRRPPRDAVNALLSFAYSILAKDCASALTSVGLDPYVGFLHADRPGRLSLALDLEEELRGPIADRFVLTGINLCIFSRRMFEYRENGAVFLNDEGRKIFLREWQKHKKKTIQHPFLKTKIEWGLVPYIQALLIARTIRNDFDNYPPFLWK